jgi:hypothetical protein
MLDERQKKIALVDRRPPESRVPFQGPNGKFPRYPCSELSRDQKAQLELVLRSLLEPYRKEDQDEVMECLKKHGGLDKCHLAFYKEGDLGDDGEWDNWRLEGPAFVWYFPWYTSRPHLDQRRRRPQRPAQRQRLTARCTATP